MQISNLTFHASHLQLAILILQFAIDWEHAATIDSVSPYNYSTAPCCDDDAAELVARVRAAIGTQGAGSAEARSARDKLAARGPEVIPYLLDGMDTADTVTANWLRTAFDEAVARTLKATPASIPADELRRAVLDTKRQGRVRRLALDVLTKIDPAAPSMLIPSMLDDVEFRRDAVAAALEAGQKAATEQRVEQAVEAFQRAFDGARDADQVRLAAAKLKALGHEVSIVEHMGFLVDWWLIGPFDGSDFKAFSNVYPPEQQIDLQASYPVKSGTAAWKRVRTTDEFGTVDLVKSLGATDDAAAYATTTVESDEPRDVQIRCGADDNLQVWLNGAKVFSKEEWQNGTRLDRFTAPIHLRNGANQLLIKVCQGPKYRDPGMANPWSFQIRISDANGKGIKLASRYIAN
jgi:hypothetical protein